jgi:hypothetical protein
MEDHRDQLHHEIAEEKARLQQVFERELEEHRCRLNEEKAQEVLAFKASLSAPPAYPPPPPPPPPREVNFVLQDDLANLPGRRVPLPTSLTFRGQVTRDRERMKIILGYARLLRKVPGAVFTDPLEDLSEVLARLRGDNRPSSPASRVARSCSGAREPPRSRVSSRSSRSSRLSRSRGRSPPERSRSPLCSTPTTDEAVVDRIRRLERRVAETTSGLREDFRLLKESVRQLAVSVQQLQEGQRHKVAHRRSLQRRTAPPLPPGKPGASAGSGEEKLF